MYVRTPGEYRKPSTPSAENISGIPAMLVVSTGMPQLIASEITIGVTSFTEVNNRQSAAYTRACAFIPQK
jgi:hypothetical protein